MVTKRDLVIAVLCTFCLTFTLFTILPTGSNYSTSGIGEYDPWNDLNDDGWINGKDGIILGKIFGANGTPINKTALLLELQARIDSLNATNLELQSRVDNLTASMLETQMELDNLNATLIQQTSDLETELAVLNDTKLGKPDFDSGWTSVILGDTLIPHTCNTTNVIVYMIGKQTGGAAHQKDYGGWMGNINWYGAYWYDLTETHIRVHRHGNDGDWQLVRIFMWKIPQS